MGSFNHLKQEIYKTNLYYRVKSLNVFQERDKLWEIGDNNLSLKLDKRLIMFLSPVISILFLWIHSDNQQLKVLEDVLEWSLIVLQQNIKKLLDDRKWEKIVNLSFKVIKILTVRLFGTVKNFLQKDTNPFIQFRILFFSNQYIDNPLNDLFLEFFVLVLFITILTNNNLGH